MKLTAVQGTGHGEWALPGSPFRRLVLEPAGIDVVDPAEPFWDLRLWFPRPEWKRGGDRLAAHLAKLPYADRHVLSHSHGLQVAAHGIAQVPVASWVSIAGPVRSHMRATYAAAAANAGQVVQIADKAFDRTQYLGQYFGLRTAPPPSSRPTLLHTRYFPQAPNVLEIRIGDIDHSRLLYEEPMFVIWQREFLTEWLKYTPSAVKAA